MSKNLAVILIGIAFLGACSQVACRSDLDKKGSAPAANTAGGGSAVTAKENTGKVEKIKVYKPDGSLQCGMGEAIALQQMQKDLGSIQVFSSANKNDGLMRIQLCGSPTGNCNVYEIEKTNLDAAVKAGFKEWSFE